MQAGLAKISFARLLRFLAVSLLCLGTLTYADHAAAQVQGIAAAPSVTCVTQTAGGGLVPNCDCYAGVANRIVGCVRQTLRNAAYAFLSPQTGFYSLVRQPIMALITLAVAIYGAMLAAGMVEKPSRDTFVLLLKLGFVIWAVENSQ